MSMKSGTMNLTRFKVEGEITIDQIIYGLQSNVSRHSRKQSLKSQSVSQTISRSQILNSLSNPS